MNVKYWGKFQFSVTFLIMKVHTGEEIVRERALRLVHTKLKTNTTDLLNREAQAQVLLVFLVPNMIGFFSADCRDQESVRLSNCHRGGVPQTDGDPQHDLLAKVHSRAGGFFDDC